MASRERAKIGVYAVLWFVCLLPFGRVARRQPPVAHPVEVAEVVQEQSGHHNGIVARLERTQYER